MRRFNAPKPKPTDPHCLPYWTIDPDCPMDLSAAVAKALEHFADGSGYEAGSSWMGPHTAQGYWKERLDNGNGEYGDSNTLASMQATLDKENKRT